VHGPKSRRKSTDYGLGLIEKQKLRYYYGLMEKQFRGVYEKAKNKRGVTGEPCCRFWKRAWTTSPSTWVSANTRAAARQLVGHGHVTVNGRKVSIPSYALKVNDVISVKNNNVSRQLATKSMESLHQPRRAGLALPQQGRVQGHRHAHPDPG
jgi:small subunit ribosomal protein S4